jgi:hypothetical protein
MCNVPAHVSGCEWDLKPEHNLLVTRSARRFCILREVSYVRSLNVHPRTIAGSARLPKIGRDVEAGALVRLGA